MDIVDREARRDAVERSLRDYKSSGATRTETIDYRGEKRSVEVIRVKPMLLLLNQNSSRLRAQLEDHPKRELVQRNPFSTEAQDVLSELLGGTEKFDDLKRELKEFGQKFPGVISRDGLLINGNTRVVALRQLNADGIDVAVLPEDAISEDFLDLEMSLQMTRLTHQDYTYTNELLLMDSYLKAGHSPQQLATKMGWTRNSRKKIDTSMRVLGIMNEIRDLSSSYVPYKIFDSNETHLKDLDESYQALQNSADVRAAENMKWSRVAAMLLGVNKDEVRTIDDGFLIEKVGKRAESGTELALTLECYTKIDVPDGLDELLGTTQSPETRIDARAIVKDLLNDASMRSEDGGIKKDFTEKFDELQKNIRLAAREVITKANIKSYQAEPAEKLRELRINLESLTSEVWEQASTEGFDRAKFQNELNQVGKALKTLEQEFGKFTQTK